MKKIMILGASILQVPAIKKAKEMGLLVIAVDKNPKAVGFEFADIPLIISTIDTPKVLDAAKKFQINGIITIASDMPMRTVAAVANELNLVGIDVDTAIKTTDKFEMRKALSDYGVPIPKFFKVNNFEQYMETVKLFLTPFIVKPSDNSGSRGIYKLNATDDVSAIEDAYRYSCQFSSNNTVLVEEFMQGEEVSVETLSIDGQCHIIQITDKLTTGAPHFVEMGHTQPTHLSNEMINSINKVAINANRAVGIINGPSHTEIKITPEGPKIVEIGARLGGDCITSHLVPFSTGVDMVECCIKIALGETPNYKRKFDRAAAIRYLDCKAGIIKKISGVEDVSKIEGIKEVSLVHYEGERVGTVKSSNDRIGFIISQANTRDKAVKLCEEAKKRINIVIE